MLQLGHVAPGDCTKRYLCNLIIEDDTPPCYEKQVIFLDDEGRMSIDVQKQTQVTGAIGSAIVSVAGARLWLDY